MLTAALALSIGATAQFQYLGYGNSDDRALATPAPYVTGVALNTAYVPQIGREYHPQVWRKDHPVYLRDWGGAGPSAYGASQFDDARYYARVGNVLVSASPWVATDEISSVHRLGNARALWLREQGYTVSPRVFRNRASGHGHRTQSLMDRYNWHKITIPVHKRPRFEVRRDGDSPARFVVAHSDSPRIVVRRATSREIVISRAR